MCITNLSNVLFLKREENKVCNIFSTVDLSVCMLTIFERHSWAVFQFQLEWIVGMSLSECISVSLSLVTVAQRRKESYHLPRFDVHLSTFINKSLSVLLPIEHYGEQQRQTPFKNGQQPMNFYNSKMSLLFLNGIFDFSHCFYGKVCF